MSGGTWFELSSTMAPALSCPHARRSGSRLSAMHSAAGASIISRVDVARYVAYLVSGRGSAVDGQTIHLNSRQPLTAWFKGGGTTEATDGESRLTRDRV